MIIIYVNITRIILTQSWHVSAVIAPPDNEMWMKENQVFQNGVYVQQWHHNGQLK